MSLTRVLGGEWTSWGRTRGWPRRPREQKCRGLRECWPEGGGGEGKWVLWLLYYFPDSFDWISCIMRRLQQTLLAQTRRIRFGYFDGKILRFPNFQNLLNCTNSLLFDGQSLSWSRTLLLDSLEVWQLLSWTLDWASPPCSLGTRTDPHHWLSHHWSWAACEIVSSK